MIRSNSNEIYKHTFFDMLGSYVYRYLTATRSHKRLVKLTFVKQKLWQYLSFHFQNINTMYTIYSTLKTCCNLIGQMRQCKKPYTTLRTLPKSLLTFWLQNIRGRWGGEGWFLIRMDGWMDGWIKHGGIWNWKDIFFFIMP